MSLVGRFECPVCGSSDGLSITERGDNIYTAYCFSTCSLEDRPFISHNTLAHSFYGDELGIKPIQHTKEINTSISIWGRKGKVSRISRTGGKGKDEKMPITKARRKEIFDKTTSRCKLFRGISQEISDKSYIRYEICEETGKVSKCYYPIFKGRHISNKAKFNLVGYSVRIVLPEKGFYTEGYLGHDCDMFNQHNCVEGGDYLLITAGEHDVLAALECISTSDKKIEGRIDILCASTSESGVADQCSYHYDFINTYKTILIDMDSDKAGRQAVGKLIDVLPVGKVKALIYSGAKDSQDMWDQGREDEYVQAILDAKQPILEGVHGGESLLQDAKDSLVEERLPFPEAVVSNLESYRFGTYNVISCDAPLIHRFLSDILERGEHKPLIISSEMDRGLLVRKILGEYKTKHDNILLDDNGEYRFSVIDDPDTLESSQDISKCIGRMARLEYRVVVMLDQSHIMRTFSDTMKETYCNMLKLVARLNKVCILSVCSSYDLEEINSVRDNAFTVGHLDWATDRLDFVKNLDDSIIR